MSCKSWWILGRFSQFITGARFWSARAGRFSSCSMEAEQLAITVHQLLIKHYGRPEWRNPLPPLDELVSTILSQNTTDTNRDRAYQALRKRFPSWEEVRDAKAGEVIEVIRPAGLANQKGPRIQQVLREITAERGSLDLSFLEDFSIEQAREWLERFKG